MKKWLCLLLAMWMLLCVGCGNRATDDGADATTTTMPAGPQPDPDLKVEDCYTYTENANLTYSYSVKGRSGNVLLSEQDIDRPVSFEVANKDVLIVCGQAGTGVGARWAKFCDIQRGRVSDTYGGYLAAVGNRVAFLDFRTDAYHVFVCDPFEPAVYTGVTTLEGVVSDAGEPVEDFALSKEGVLSVTYRTESGSKTVTIDLNEEE